ncbi:TPA: tetratricopeptide repeat protein, partial [bacterium]|nr:tetratricopeptide repeat protein [bacterium]
MKRIFIIFISVFIFILSACSQPLTPIMPMEKLDDEYYLKKIRTNPENLNVHRELINKYKSNGIINIPIDIYSKAVEKNQNNAIVYYVLGYAYLADGSAKSLELAEKNLNKALELNPQFVDALTALGDYYLKTGNEELAVEKWQNARRINERFAPVYLSFARYYRSKKQYTKAEQEYEDAILWTSAGRAEAYMEFGTMYIETNDLTKAEEMLLKARGENPRSSAIHYKLGQLYAIKGDRDSAIRSYRSGRKFDPNDSKSAYELAYIFLEKNDLKYAMLSFERGLVSDGIDEETSKELITSINKGVGQGIEYLVKLADSKQSKNFDLIYFIGKLYLAQNKEDLAFKYFQRGVAMPNTNPDVHYQLGLLLEKRKPQIVKSEEIVKPKVMEDKNKESSIKTQSIESQSIVEDVVQKADAQEQYRKAVDMGSSEAELLFRVAQGYLDEGQEDKYIEVAEKALTLEPNKLDVHLKLAEIFLRRAEEYKKNGKLDDEEKAILNSIKHYEQVTTLGPDAQRWYNLGMLYERAGKSRAIKAERAYEQAIQIKP